MSIEGWLLQFLWMIAKTFGGLRDSIQLKRRGKRGIVMTQGEGVASTLPTEEQVRILVYQTMEQMYLQSQATAKLLLEVQAQLVGAQAATQAVTGVVDDNAEAANRAIQMNTAKEVASHLYERAQIYVSVIVAGGFAAYFTTLGIVAPRLSSRMLIESSFWMTISVSVFVFYEVLSLSFISYRIMRGNLEALGGTRTMQVLWGGALMLTIGTALPGICLSLYAYLGSLGYLP